MGLWRQMCVSAGLMSSDGGLVFLQLAMVPCLQALGVPVPLVTVAGVISGSLALMGLPVVGWISDGGRNPHRRKKPAVALSALVFVAGYSLVIAGCALRLRSAVGQRPPGTVPSSFTNLTTVPGSNVSSSSSSSDPNLALLPSHFRPGENYDNTNFNASKAKLQTLDSWRSPPSEDGGNTSESPFSSGTLEGSPKNGSSTAASPDYEDDDPLGVGIPLTGLLGILGFVFMDMGNDLSNSCVKSLVLSCTARSQHSSLFVVGVLMSALGGCLAAVLGVLDIAAFIVRGQDLDAVPAKTLLQAGFFLMLTVVCMLVTLCSAPAIAPNTSDDTETLVAPPTPSQQPSDASQPELQGYKVQNEYLQTPESDQDAEFLNCGRLSVKNTTLKMVPVCVSMFFMAGAWQSFNICVTDYLGKVVYDGDPEADRASQPYAAYRQGLRSGSLGVLMLNVAYVIVNMLQKKILALIGPKVEYLLVCAVQVTVLVSLQLTDRVEVFYTAAVVYGLFRSVMYTVPFMLANTICQQASRSCKNNTINSSNSNSQKTVVAKVGSTMALMTAMMPLSYVLVSTVTGPIIHATGDPAAPLYYAAGATGIAALVFAFT